jgi:hypothetical protein
MPDAPRNKHESHHAGTGRISRAAAPFPPTVESQCRAAVARFEKITAPGAESDDGEHGASIDFRALDSLPDPTGWGGRAIVPWGTRRPEANCLGMSAPCVLSNQGGICNTTARSTTRSATRSFRPG